METRSVLGAIDPNVMRVFSRKLNFGENPAKRRIVDPHCPRLKNALSCSDITEKPLKKPQKPTYRFDSISESPHLIVFRFLRLPDIIRLSLTSKHWEKRAFTLGSSFHPICYAYVCVSTSSLSSMTSRFHTKNLKSIDLSFVSRVVTDTLLQVISESCKSVRYLNLNGCGRITDRGLDDIANNCLHIRTISCTACHQITQNGISKILSKLEKLETLNLAWCARVSSDIMPFVLEASVRKKLRTIVLSDTNTFLSHIHALQRCLTEPLPKTLTLVGGLRRKETYEDVFEQQLDFLQRMNVKYQQFPEESCSNRQCRERINQLKESKKILDSAILKSEGSEKVYVLCRTDRGAFGIKIRPSDFLELPRTDLISWLRRKSPEDLLEYLCRLVDNFDWLHMFQGYHTLSHVGVWDCTNRNGNGDLWVENAAGWCKRVATEMDCDEPEEVNAIFPQQIEWE